MSTDLAGDLSWVTGWGQGQEAKDVGPDPSSHHKAQDRNTGHLDISQPPVKRHGRRGAWQYGDAGPTRAGRNGRRRVRLCAMRQVVYEPTLHCPCGRGQSLTSV